MLEVSLWCSEVSSLLCVLLKQRVVKCKSPRRRNKTAYDTGEELDWKIQLSECSFICIGESAK